MTNAMFPTTDAGLLAWSLNLSQKLTASPTSYNCTAAIATAYAAVHAAFAAALAACDPAERTQSAVSTKNQARANLKYQAKLVAAQVYAGASVTDAQKIELGMPPRATPQPIPQPTYPPALIIQSVSGWAVSGRLKDSQDSDRRGKPAGVTGASVFSFVGANPPTDISQWKFEGNTGKSKFTVVFPNTVAAGAKVWLAAFWFNGRKQSGPMCNPQSVNLQAGGVQLTIAA